MSLRIESTRALPKRALFTAVFLCAVVLAGIGYRLLDSQVEEIQRRLNAALRSTGLQAEIITLNDPLIDLVAAHVNQELKTEHFGFAEIAIRRELNGIWAYRTLRAELADSLNLPTLRSLDRPEVQTLFQSLRPFLGYEVYTPEDRIKVSEASLLNTLKTESPEKFAIVGRVIQAIDNRRFLITMAHIVGTLLSDAGNKTQECKNLNAEPDAKPDGKPDLKIDEPLNRKIEAWLAEIQKVQYLKLMRAPIPALEEYEKFLREPTTKQFRNLADHARASTLTRAAKKLCN